MALVVLVSAKGAPGVTTLTVALAALTPAAVAADLDPDGGDLALRYRRPDGAPLDADLGLLSLASGLRRDLPGHRTSPEGPTRLEDHLQVTAGGLDLLLGLNGPEQAAGLGSLWTSLARSLSEAGRTVFADCGRASPSSPVMPVLQIADAVIVVARPELEELAHLRERLRFLNSAVPGRFAGRAQIGVILVASERDRAVAGRTEQLLHSSGVGVPVLGTVALDQRGADALRGLNRTRLGRSTLIRSVRTLLPSVSLLAGTIPELTVSAMPVHTARTTRTMDGETGAAPPTPAPTPQPVLAPATEPEVAPEPEPEVAPAPEVAPEPEPEVKAEPLVTRIVELPAAEERTMPVRRRRNSFFGDVPPLEEDPDLLPAAVAPGIYAPAQSHANHRAVASPGDGMTQVRGFSGLTPPQSQPRRARRHVIPAEETETTREETTTGTGWPGSGASNGAANGAGSDGVVR